VNIHIIGVPCDLGASRQGCNKGPDAIRYAYLDKDKPHDELDLSKRLRQLGHAVTDEGNLAVSPAETPPYCNPKLKNLEPILAVCNKLAEVVEHTCHTDKFPLIIGGDHSIALGSVKGVAGVHGPIGVLWIDAHGDFNTDRITLSGNIHGMPLAALAGYGDSRLVNLGGSGPAVDPVHVAVVGARDLDCEEQKLLRKAGVHVFTMKDIDRLGFAATMAQALEFTTNGTKGVHVSFDIDAVDPSEAPGVGTRVPGGLTYREARLAMELIADSGKLTSLDIVEDNPTLDEDNRTSKLAVKLILSALGKSLFYS